MNTLMPITTTSTELQRNYRKVVTKSKKTQGPVIIMFNNKPEGVYIDYGTFIRKYVEKVVEERKVDQVGLLKPFGSWSKEEADRFDKIIEDAFEQIDPGDWK